MSTSFPEQTQSPEDEWLDLDDVETDPLADEHVDVRLDNGTGGDTR